MTDFDPGPQHHSDQGGTGTRADAFTRGDAPSDAVLEYRHVSRMARGRLRRVGILMAVVIVLVGVSALGKIFQLALVGALVAAVATLTSSLKLRRLGRELDRLGRSIDAERQPGIESLPADIVTGTSPGVTKPDDAGGAGGPAT